MIGALARWLRKAALAVLTRLWDAGHPTNTSGNNMSQR